MLAVEEYLSAMPWNILNEDISWQVAIGTDRKGPEIVKVIAGAYPTPVNRSWLVSDGIRTRMRSPKGTILGFIIGKLDTMFRGGVCSDVSNLPESVEVVGCSF